MNASEAVKIVIVGNVGSGKTTGLKAISEIPVIGTEEKATETEALHRQQPLQWNMVLFTLMALKSTFTVHQDNDGLTLWQASFVKVHLA